MQGQGSAAKRSKTLSFSRDLDQPFVRDTSTATIRNERLSAPNGRACNCMARSEDGRRQRVLPQCCDECDDVGEA